MGESKGVHCPCPSKCGRPPYNGNTSQCVGAKPPFQPSIWTEASQLNLLGLSEPNVINIYGVKIRSPLAAACRIEPESSDRACPFRVAAD